MVDWSDDVPWATVGGNLAVNRLVFDQVGLFDQSLMTAVEDSEWGYRAYLAGFKIDRSSELYMYHRRDIEGIITQVRSWFAKGSSVTRYQVAVGESQPKGSLRYIARCLGHASLKRCSGGLLGAALELGSYLEWRRVTDSAK